MAKSTRVFELAREVGVSSKDVIAKCKAEDIPNITNHMSAVSLGLAVTIKEWFTEGDTKHTAVERSAKVDVKAARAKATKKAARKKTATGDETPGTDTMASATAIAEPVAPVAPVAPVETVAPEAPAETVEAATPNAAPVVPAAPAAPAAPATPAAPVETPTAPAEPVSIPATAPEAPVAPDAPAAPETPVAPQRAAGTDDAGPKAGGETPAAEATVPTVIPGTRSAKTNIPERPSVVGPAGPKLQQPKKTALAGPRIIRVEAPEPVSAPRSPRGNRDRPSHGARTGQGVGGGGGMRGPGDSGMGGPSVGAGVGGRSGGGAGVGGRGSGRNQRRKTGAPGAAGAGRGDSRTGRTGQAGGNRGFNWREQDLRERANRLNRSEGFFRAARRDQAKRGAGAGTRAKTAVELGGAVRVEEPITLKSLSSATGIKVNDLIRKMMQTGGQLIAPGAVMETTVAEELMINWSIELDVIQQKSAADLIVEEFSSREMANEQSRSPVVTILGHVDHGKTTLLDSIRKANVASGEAGGITQATSAFSVPVSVADGERMITFIDTPGHEAFTEMRSRGAKMTDIVVLVVAADDGVMPQTIESINHAKAAGVPIIVALNKIDKPEATDANIQRILGQLAEHELNPVDWGGSTEILRIAALKGEGVKELLDVLDYQAQLLELTADFSGQAEGAVIEAQMEEGRGAVARILIQQGKLKKGDYIAIGRAYGRVRDIVNDRGERIKEAGPSTPVAISGINEVPDAGDQFYVVKNQRAAEAAAGERKQAERERNLATEKITLDNIFDVLARSGRKELPLIVKADVHGSLETLNVQLPKIGSDEVAVVIKHSAVGGVNESDVMLAEASSAIIVGFNVTAAGKARKAADARGVDIRFYDVIYDLTDDVKSAAEGLLDPELKLEVLGHADVREVFKISKVGAIAGCYVTDGTIERNAQIRVTRDGIVIEKDRRLEQLKRFKDDAKEVNAGQECGMKIDGYNDIRVGDVLECYRTKEVRRTL